MNPEPNPPSSHWPLLEFTHESSLSITIVFSRNPHAAQSVLISQRVGRKEENPPSWHRVSPIDVVGFTQELAHAVKGMYGGDGGEGATYGDGGVGGGGVCTSPVTVNALSEVRCSPAQLLAHDNSPSSVPGQSTERWLSRRERSIVRALVSRFRRADAWP